MDPTSPRLRNPQILHLYPRSHRCGCDAEGCTRLEGMGLGYWKAEEQVRCCGRWCQEREEGLKAGRQRGCYARRGVERGWRGGENVDRGGGGRVVGEMGSDAHSSARGVCTYKCMDALRRSEMEMKADARRVHSAERIAAAKSSLWCGR